jgi:ABC-type glycerol-3-phosphate transport system permease component
VSELRAIPPAGTSPAARAPSRKVASGTVVRFVALCLMGFVISIPFVWMLSASFKPRAEVEEVSIVPSKPTLRNYPVVLNLQRDPGTGKFLDLRFGRWYFNSIFLATCITVLQVLTSAMAAYAFSRMHWRGRDKVFLAYLASRWAS